MQRIKHPFFFIIAVSMLTILGPLTGICAEKKPTKILIFPPEIHAADQMDYLEKGIVDMLSSRLFEGGVVEIVPFDRQQMSSQIPQDPEAVKSVARQFGADLLVLTSVTVLGGRISTDVKVAAAGDGKLVLSYGQTGQNQADIIDHIDQAAEQINTRILHRGSTSAALPPTKAASPQTGDGTGGQQKDIYQHPEKLLNQGIMVQSEPADANQPGRPMVSGQLMSRGRRLKTQLKGVTAGDVNGDGKVEIVCIDGHTVYIYRIEQDTFVKMDEIKGSGNYITVETADVNQNGIEEIFITNFDNENGRTMSFVLEWDGSAFQRLASNLHWYFRTIQHPDRGKLLVGQRQGATEVFLPGIFEITWQQGDYIAGERLPLPRNLSVFGFAYGDVMAKNDSSIVSYDKDGYLSLLDKTGAKEWESSDPYGVSDTFIEFKDENDPKEKTRLFVAPRMQLFDADGDGLQEVVAIKNVDTAGVLSSKIRMMKQGRLEILKWDQLGVVPIWRTRDLSKFIAGIVLVDLDGDGKEEIVAAVVSSTRNSFSSGGSYLVVFKFGGPSEGR